MKTLPDLFENNKKWVESVKKRDPQYFERLSKQQLPKYLWIGCSDSRVPANEITGLDPGEVFVHRNIANMVVHTDFNCLSVVQYAVEVLHVTDIIVCGHYGCGGVNAAMDDKDLGLIDNWIRNIKDIHRRKIKELEKISEPEKKADRLCELNVIQQVLNLSHTSIVHNAWKNGIKLNIHGWIYSIRDGLLRDLGVGVFSENQIHDVYKFSDPE